MRLSPRQHSERTPWRSLNAHRQSRRELPSSHEIPCTQSGPHATRYYTRVTSTDRTMSDAERSRLPLAPLTRLSVRACHGRTTPLDCAEASRPNMYALLDHAGHVCSAQREEVCSPRGASSRLASAPVCTVRRCQMTRQSELKMMNARCQGNSRSQHYTQGTKLSNKQPAAP